MDLEGYESGTEILIHLISFNLNEEEISSMKKNGNITRQRRCGLVDNVHGSFGLVDNLSMTYVGNMLTSVCDSASRYSYVSGGRRI